MSDQSFQLLLFILSSEQINAASTLQSLSVSYSQNVQEALA